MVQINLKVVEGTGRDGRILKEDMLRHIESLRGLNSKNASPSEIKPMRSADIDKRTEVHQPAAPKVTPAKGPTVPIGTDRTEPIKGFKRAMVKSMMVALVRSFL